MKNNMKKITYILTAGLLMLSACSEAHIDKEPEQPPVTPSDPPVEQGDFVQINGGSFTMGSPEDERWRENDEVQHQVTVGPYLIAKYEVSQADYRSVTGVNPSYFQGDNRPVEMVSWYDAVRFCNALSLSEGLEPEWEYACRAGTDSPFSTGRNITVEQSNWYSSYPYIEGEGGGTYRRQTVDVDEFEPNPWGLYNMHGNVSEWCWDYYGAYTNAAGPNPSGPETGRNRVARGGGWYDYAKHVRSAYRSAVPADYTDYKRGFRLARNVE